uniref:Uncharacterized protein n=1 Tax=Tetraselmis chuii TaxID=63592 RepID=A0A7S1X8N1_9CHLO|mmetsp:Transcript_4652/g.8465  ORF Transcript_4652/g.8465 Transcript_4652/m.8465 type:complete len:504 (+) Transcript_4652:538-2049(+)|eukprot:CAMPEP_0177760628 /NCGR_PEP_ID=MMETSP0491_2-20121128/5365_1 /TAXON_ID=63592 /ORGANISM="Tetraselmis chuii, Strain PLY429" /LENGTH=503 /DNA_ID=CAMNT_0019276533 /DNA_START=496 /DNA_END=2007 /DNA_ORIENTATION=+
MRTIKGEELANIGSGMRDPEKGSPRKGEKDTNKRQRRRRNNKAVMTGRVARFAKKTLKKALEELDFKTEVSLKLAPAYVLTLQTTLVVVVSVSVGASLGYFPDAVRPPNMMHVPATVVGVDKPPPFANLPPTYTATQPPMTTSPPFSLTSIPTPTAATPSTEPRGPPNDAIPMSSLLWWFDGHNSKADGLVEGVAISADGALVATGGRDHLGTLLDAQNNGTLLFAYDRVYVDDVYTVAMNADGSLLATGSRDHNVYLLSGRAAPSQYSVDRFQRIATLEGHGEMVKSVSLSADGRMLVSGCEGGDIFIWDTTTFEPRDNLTSAHQHSVTSVALSADGSRLASGGGDGHVRLWNTPPAGRGGATEPHRTLQGHTGVVHTVAIAANGELVASGSEDKTARVWEFSTGELMHELKGHGGDVMGVSLSADGALLATGCWNGTIRLWDARRDAHTTSPLHVIQDFDDRRPGVTVVSLSADGSLLAAGSTVATVYLWNITGVVGLFTN